jgi:hypothetical protein
MQSRNPRTLLAFKNCKASRIRETIDTDLFLSITVALTVACAPVRYPATAYSLLLYSPS